LGCYCGIIIHMLTVQNLKKEVKKLKQNISLRDSVIEKKDIYIKTLEETLQKFKKHRFGSKSEKSNNNQLNLFNEAELIDDTPAPSKKPKKKKKPGKRATLPKNLERVEVEHDVDESQKICPHDQSQLKHIGEIVTEQLQFKPAVIKVIKHKQFKYACKCCGKHIITAKKPKEIIPKSIATAELLSYITVSKYTDSLPLYRLCQMFKRIDVKISRQNMANWMIKCSHAVQPLVNLIRDELYEQPCIHIDETTLNVLKDSGSMNYMWAQRSGNNIIFDYQSSRSAAIVEGLLANYKGAIMTDGYPAYDAVAIKFLIVHLACWAHTRRYFVEVLDHGKNPNASKVLAFIGKLYAIEKRIKNLEPDKIYQQRQLHSKPILDDMKIFIDKVLHTTTPSGAMGKALKYIQNQWHKLIRYIDDGCYPIDNNAAENVIRPFVVGRKNWLFANTPSGAHASANLYSIIETAKAHGLNPQEYLNYIYKQLPLVESVDDYEKLLPRNFKSSNEQN